MNEAANDTPGASDAGSEQATLEPQLSPEDQSAMAEFVEAMAEAEKDPNRLRAYIVYEQVILHMVSQGWTLDAFVVGMQPQLPPGARISRVHHDYARRAFVFIVWHPSFESVTPSKPIPVMGDLLEFQQVNAIREPDGRYRIDIPGASS